MEYAIRHDDVARFLRCRVGETLETMDRWLRPRPRPCHVDEEVAEVVGRELFEYLDEHDKGKAARKTLRDALYDAHTELYARDGFEIPATVLGLLALQMVLRIAALCLARGDLEFTETLPSGIKPSFEAASVIYMMA
eukprot:jgi/Mesvir1/18495/Mv14340-RA.1